MPNDSERQGMPGLTVVEPEAETVETIARLGTQLQCLEGDLRNHIGISSFYDEAMRNLVINDEPRNAVEIKQGMVLVGDWLVDKSDELIHAFGHLKQCCQTNTARQEMP